ncbi:hypothetical protein LA52FAK_39750 [Desulforhopalus sp. 52FAK]
MWLCGFHDGGSYNGDYKVRQVLEYLLMCERPARHSLNHTLVANSPYLAMNVSGNLQDNNLCAAHEELIL